MTSTISSYDALALAFLEEASLPPHFEIPRYSSRWCVTCLQQAVNFSIVLPLAAVTRVLSLAEQAFCKVLSYVSSPTDQTNPLINFTAVLQDSRAWNKISHLKERLLKSPPGAHNKDFLYGTASCTYQDSGYTYCPNSQWAPWEKKILPENNQSHQSANLFALYQTDPHAVIARLKELGVNSYRTSVEWSHIEPTPGEFDDAKMQVYVDFCKKLLENHIEPMITLHHFSEPQWFHDKGSFEKEENIQDFVRFSKYVYQHLSQEVEGRSLVQYFCTINEPAIEAFSRFIRGAYSPGVVGDFHRAALFLKGALKAHFTVYKALKELPPQDTNIGFSHQYLHFISANPLVTPAAYYLSKFINDTTLELFRTKTFSAKIPFMCHVTEPFDPQEIQADFIGVQYYTRPLLGLTGSIPSHPEEAMTAMPFREDPAGLYEALTETYNACHTPLFVTENGISTHDPQQRERYMMRALYALKEAEKTLGADLLKGYYQWSLVDNLEWDMGMKPQAFGAFALTNQGQDTAAPALHPKEGSSIFTEVIKAQQDSLLRH